MPLDDRSPGETLGYGQLLQAQLEALTATSPRTAREPLGSALDGAASASAEVGSRADMASRGALVALLRRALDTRREAPGGWERACLRRRLAFAEALGRSAPPSVALAVLAHLELVLPRLQAASAAPFAAAAASGEALFACSLAPAWIVGGRPPAMRARPERGGYRLEGVERGVRFADRCDYLLLKCALERQGNAGSAHLLVHRSMLSSSLVASPDGVEGAADVHLAEVFVDERMRMGCEDVEPEPSFAAMRDWAALLCSLCNGAAFSMLDELWRHARDRGTRKVALADEPRVRAELAWLRCRAERSRAVTLLVEEAAPRRESAQGVVAAAILISRRTARDVGSFAAKLQGARSYAGTLRGARYHLESAAGPLWSAPDDVLLAAVAQASRHAALATGATP